MLGFKYIVTVFIYHVELHYRINEYEKCTPHKLYQVYSALDTDIWQREQFEQHWHSEQQQAEHVTWHRSSTASAW